jgi:glycosyltransferase involved in cell wall biosynthesis
MRLPPRILFVTESFGVGGTENHLLDLLPALKGKGFEVATFCFTAKGSRAPLLEDMGIPVYAAPELGQSKRSLSALIRMSGGAVKLFTLIKRFRPSIVHFYLPGPYLAGAPVAIAAGVPIKLMSRRSMADYQTKWPGAAAAERLLHTRMDALLGNARAVTDELVREGGPETKVHLIYNGVRPPDAPMSRAEAREALGLDAQTFVATTVANLLPYKGHLDLIAALAEIAGRLPQPWMVLCAGRDGGSRAGIEQAIAQAGIGETVRLLGERSDVPLLLAASDLGILAPTLNEGFSNAVLESMAVGLPMVVADVGGNAEAVIDSETGLVVPHSDPKVLGEAILELARDPTRRRAMGDAARLRAIQEFSLATSVDKYCTLYDNLLEQAR